MFKSVTLAVALAFLGLPAAYAQDVAHAVEGTVKTVDAATRIIVVKTADGTDHAFHFTGHTAVHGAEATATGAKDTFHGLKDGSEVVVHYTTNGTERTAAEVDRVDKDGLKASEGTLKSIDRGARTMTIKTKDGTEQTYRLTKNAAVDAGKDMGKGADRTERVTVYYSDEAGHKVAHFFKRVF
jgi:flagellar hook-associated protein FlgK